MKTLRKKKRKRGNIEDSENVEEMDIDNTN